MNGRLAVPVRDGVGLQARLDRQLGRAAAFVVVDLDGSVEPVYLINEGVQAEQGAGIGAAALLLQHGVTAVAAEHFGPKAEQALRAGGAALYTAPGGLTVAEVLERFRAGTLVRHELKVY
ncbi:MAG: NifB/NifX family molybdenum-iron cluster-binding protein [Deltaproteobacteria bacterium]|nr:NifB/NifX family molybdenum-iron cluster-binding protein [Deltaproteobacteria bacterium]